MLPYAILGQLLATRGLFFLPDTFPIPSRDQFRHMLGDALHRCDSAEHLKEWISLVGNHNTAKNQIRRFARLFELRHYWHILQQRHGDLLAKRTSDFKTAIARFLGVNIQALRRDLRFAQKRLGPL